MSWSFRGLLGKVRQRNTTGLSQWAWLRCFGAQSVMQPRHGADGIAPRCQAPMGTAPAKGREQIPSLRQGHE